MDDQDRERVRQATDFVALAQEGCMLHERRAGDWWGRCPFHEEKTESFHIMVDRGTYHCFGCGASGDVFDFVMRREGMEFPEALRFLADRAGIELSQDRRGQHGPRRSRLYECLDRARDRFSSNLLRRREPQGELDAARRYLASRSLGSAVCRRWGLGYALGHRDLLDFLKAQGFADAEILAADLAVPGRGGGLNDRFFGRVMFPIANEQGQTIAFGGRVLDDAKPKYLNTKETALFHKSRNFYAIDRAKAQITATGRAIVVEGYTDVIAMHEAGITNVVAILGTALTADHLKVLNRYRPREIVSLLDGDAAGQRAAEKAVRYVGATEARLTCVVLPDNQDPAEYLAAHGPSAMRERLAGARDLVVHVIEQRLGQLTGASPGAKRRILGEVCEILAPLKDDALSLSEYLPVVADAFDVGLDELRRQVRQTPVPDLTQAAPGRDEEVSLDFSDDGYGEGPVVEPLPDLRSLTPRQRERILLERQLLVLLASDLGPFQEHLDMLRALEWEDPRHGRIAEALIAQPATSSPAQLADVAKSVDPLAPQILAASEFERWGDGWGRAQAGFMVDQLWQKTLQARGRRVSLDLQSAELAGDEGRIESLLRASEEIQAALRGVESRLRSANFTNNSQ